VITIDVLPDDVLLVIFDLCVYQDEGQDLSQLRPYDFPKRKEIESWQALVHVCQRWRSVVFGSPRHLDLLLVCSTNTPARDTLDVWPDLPLFIQGMVILSKHPHNIIPVLQRRDRVCRIHLELENSKVEEVLAAMQVPFPELTYLRLGSFGVGPATTAVLPDSFLGGCAPHLRSLSLSGIPFPGLPKLILSATHLAYLDLDKISHSGYVSPEAMVTALSTLGSLERLSLGFVSPRSRPDQASRLPPPPTRTLLPVLTTLKFKGVSEYLEDLVARIDAPRLSDFRITFFNDIVFDTSQLARFIYRTPISSKARKTACVLFEDAAARINFSSAGGKYLSVGISCEGFDWQVSSLEQLFTSFLSLISTSDYLYIYETPPHRSKWLDSIENMRWLNLLHQFTTVEKLYLSKRIAPLIVAALQELVGSGTTEVVLPTLQNIFLGNVEPSEPVQEGIGQFVAARQLTSHQIAVSRWGGIY
jgi:hypothetical protein